jgi:hypothetical protein
MGADQSTPASSGAESNVSALVAQYGRAINEKDHWFGHQQHPGKRGGPTGFSSQHSTGQSTGLWSQPRPPTAEALEGKATSPAQSDRTLSLGPSSTVDSDSDAATVRSNENETGAASRQEQQAREQGERSAVGGLIKQDGYPADVGKLSVSSAERAAARNAFMQHIKSMQHYQTQNGTGGQIRSTSPLLAAKSEGAPAEPPTFKSGEGGVSKGVPVVPRPWKKFETVNPAGKDPYRMGKYDVITTQLHGKEVVKADACAGISYYRGIDEELAAMGQQQVEY